MRRLLLGLLLVAACGSRAPIQPPGFPLDEVELRYRLIAQVGPPLYCDRDEYPVGHPITQQELDAFVQQEGKTQFFKDIVAHHGYVLGQLTHDQQLAVYQDWKQLQAIPLKADSQVYDFAYTAGQQSPAGIFQVAGTIDRFGHIKLRSRTPGRPPPCPICLSEGALIATPAGERPVSRIRPGQLVWTAGRGGERVAAPLLEVASRPATPGQQIVSLVLDDGRRLLVSAGHPTGDGRRVGELRPGDRLDGARVVAAEPQPYTGAATWDLLPAGPTGQYWANGIRLGSTLVRN